MDRERYGRGSGGGGGINRYPDVSGRTRPATPPREDRSYSRGGDRPSSSQLPRSSNEPWSDVPPELEEMLRAQVAQKPAAGRPGSGSTPATEHGDPLATNGSTAIDAGEPAVKAPAKPRAGRKPATAKSASGDAATAATKPRATRKPTGAAGTGASEPAAKAAAKPRATRKPAASDTGAAVDGAAPAPKRRTTRKTAPTEPA